MTSVSPYRVSMCWPLDKDVDGLGCVACWHLEKARPTLTTCHTNDCYQRFQMLVG